MKRLSNQLHLLAFLALLLPAPGFTLGSDSLFSTVPSGDITYSQLAQLEKEGLIPKSQGKVILTRFEVADLIWKAQGKYDEIVLAQADDIPPPPPDGVVDTTPAPANDKTSPAPAPAVAPPQTPASPAFTTPPAAAPSAVDDEAALAEAKKNLHSLTEAYQYELKRIKDKVGAVKDHATALDASQYDLWRRLQGVIEYPNVAIHGLGRAFAFSQQYFGIKTGFSFDNSTVRNTYGYLDLMPEGVVQKEVRWNSILRLGTLIEPDSSTDLLVFRRISLEVKAPWFSATLGDFDESYTPLTLWNRDNLDLRYRPEMFAREDDTKKYESFFNNEPNWPFRGLRLSTDVVWPDPSPLGRLQLSAFTHMIANGFNADQKNSGFVGPTNFTDWIFAGQGRLDLQKWYMGGMSLQIGLGAHLVILDEPLYTNTPGASYQPFDSTTWAHQYVINSWDPELRLGLGGDAYLGGLMDLAYSTYRDDKLDTAKDTSDYAMLGGPYFQFGDSKIGFNFLDVGPNYFSPLAQTRQDNVDGSNLPFFRYAYSPELFQPLLRNQYFLSNVPRAGAIYGLYDRTQDNTFPYGLATPNRQGMGLELDIKTLEKQALKVKGSAYLVQEIGGNIVANITQTGFTTVDAPAPGTVLTRKFTYVNIGPSLNLGPLMGWDRDLEIGGNARFEQTNSSLGTLTSTWILGGLRVGVLPSVDLSTAFSSQNVNGTEMGYQDSLFARYSYLFDNSDVGSYEQFNVNGSIQSLRFSTDFKVNRNSNFYLDYDITQGNLHPAGPIKGTLHNEYMEITYEIKF